jgi:hypothetical protein
LAKKEYKAVLNTTGIFFEFYPQLSGNWEKDKYQWLDIYREMVSTKKDRTEFNKYGKREDKD